MKEGRVLLSLSTLKIRLLGDDSFVRASVSRHPKLNRKMMRIEVFRISHGMGLSPILVAFQH